MNGKFFYAPSGNAVVPKLFSQYILMLGETQNIDFYGGPHELISRTTRVPQSLLGQCKVFFEKLQINDFSSLFFLDIAI